MITPSWFQLISLAPQGPALTQELLTGYLVGDDMMSGSLEEFRAGFSDLLNEINTQDVVNLEKLQAGRKPAAADQGSVRALLGSTQRTIGTAYPARG